MNYSNREFQSEFRKNSNDYLRKDITLSLIHMMCIRMFGVNSKEEKMVLNIQNRTIRKRIAIKKYSKGEENIHGI